MATLSNPAIDGSTTTADREPSSRPRRLCPGSDAARCRRCCAGETVGRRGTS